jgi:hypothetical protein
MARTARDLITRSLRIINVLASGETADATDASDGLLAFNHMLDMWSADRLLAYLVQEVGPFSLTAGQSTYTIGLGGQIDTALPISIDYAFTRDSVGIDRKANPISSEEYAAIPLKTVGNTFPSVFWYFVTAPLGQIHFYPVPQGNLSLYLGVWQPFTEFASLDTTIVFPAGLESALVYSLAEVLAIEYSRPVGPDLARLAQSARAKWSGTNLPETRSVVEFTGQDAGGVSYADFIRGFT